MCTVSPDKPESSACSDAPFSSPQLPVLIEQLKSVVASLQALSVTTDSDHATDEEEEGITRCFYIPARVVRNEGILLHKYGVEDLRELLERISSDFRTTVMLLKNYDISWEEHDGFSISLAADHILLPLNLLDEVCSLLADFEEVFEEASEE